MIRTLKFSIAASLGVFLVACGGGGDSISNTPPAIPALQVAASAQMLHFTWQPADGATSYRLLASESSGEPFALFTGNLTGLAYDRPTPTLATDWQGARFQLDACNANGCSSSEQISILPVMNDAIGVINEEHPGIDNSFGSQVALSSDGRTLAVGATGNNAAVAGTADDCAVPAPANCVPHSGSVSVYRRVAGNWVLEATLKASNPGAYDYFGEALALSADGNTLAIGAYGEDGASAGTGTEPDSCNGLSPLPPCAPNSGAVYLYTRTGSIWTRQAYLKAAHVGSGDSFGDEVALSADGNLLAVAAMRENSDAVNVGGNPVADCDAATPTNCAADSGAVYLFARSGPIWIQTTYIKKRPSVADIYYFGWMIALSGDGSTLAIVFRNSSPDTGYVDVMQQSGGVWTVRASPQADGTGAALLAVALSYDGSALAIGSPFVNGGAGSVAVLTQGDQPWSTIRTLWAPTEVADRRFGYSVAFNNTGTMLAVGAPGDGNLSTGIDSDPAYSCTVDDHADCALASGAVYLMAYNGDSWLQESYLKAPTNEPFFIETILFHDAASADVFGRYLALSGDGSVLAVGAPLNDSGSPGVGATSSDDCESSAPLNCVLNAGSVFIY